MSADYYRVVSALPTGTAFSRFMMVVGESRSDRHRELTLAEGLKIRRRCMGAVEMRTKAAVAVGTTTDSTWAGPLATYRIAGEALTPIWGKSIMAGWCKQQVATYKGCAPVAMW